MADPVRDFALDDNGDMAVSGGDISTVAGAAAVGQAVKIKLRMFLGEVFADQSLGVDYLNRVFVKGADPLVVNSLLKTQLLTIPDITDVYTASMQIDRAARTATLAYKIRTVYSTSPISDTVSVELP